MKKTGIIIAVVVVFGLLMFNWVKNAYNTAVVMQEEVNAKWGNVESTYQRRTDLIPNLVNTVKGYAEHEQEVLTQVTEARAKATSVQINPGNLNAESIRKFQEAQAGLSSALSRLLVTVEKYPDLKANQNFLQLQAQLEGTENRINVARERFNDSVKAYNAQVRKFPRRYAIQMLADEDEFPRMEVYEAEAGSEKAPEVQF